MDITPAMSTQRNWKISHTFETYGTRLTQFSSISFTDLLIVVVVVVLTKK